MATRQRKTAAKAGAQMVLRFRDQRGEWQVTLPPGARLTFGPNLPASRAERNRIEPFNDTERMKFALRVYGDRTNASLLACFPSVEWFRPFDMAVTQVLTGEDGVILDAPVPPPMTLPPDLRAAEARAHLHERLRAQTQAQGRIDVWEDVDRAVETAPGTATGAFGGAMTYRGHR